MITFPPVTFTLLGGPFIDVFGGSASGGPAGVGGSVGGYLYALGENAVVFFQDFFGRASKCFGVWVVDIASGDTTYYSCGPHSPGTSILQILNYGGGNFLVVVNGGSDYFVQVANQKSNNSTPILIRPASAPVSTPCYNSISRTYYDAAHGLLGVASYDPTGQYGGPIYASTYAVGAGGVLSLVAQGYAGNYLSAGGGPGSPSDDWDKTTSVGSATHTFSQSNGIMGGSFTDSNYIQSLVQNSYLVEPGINTGDCTTKSGAQVTSLLAAQVETGIGGGDGNSTSVDFIAGNFVGLYNNSVGIIVYAGGGLFFKIPYNATQPWYAPSPCNGVVIAGSNIVHQAPSGWDGTSAYGLHYSLYKAASPALSASPSATHRGIGLVNGARPISVTGKYKA